MASSYVKWVANANRHEDWTTELDLGDGNVVRQGVPVQLDADTKKALEADGRIFESSSADEAKEYEETTAQPVGADIAGSAPTAFENAGPQPPEADVSDKSNDKK